MSQRSTWRLTDDNYDRLCREMTIRQQVSLNATLNHLLADYWIGIDAFTYDPNRKAKAAKA